MYHAYSPQLDSLRCRTKRLVRFPAKKGPAWMVRKTFTLKWAHASARIWPRLSHSCQKKSTADYLIGFRLAARYLQSTPTQIRQLMHGMSKQTAGIDILWGVIRQYQPFSWTSHGLPSSIPLMGYQTKRLVLANRLCSHRI